MISEHSIDIKIGRKKLGLYELTAGSILLLNACLRFTLISLNWPLTNSDEATAGLMARHIAYHGALPIFFYGQGYMGSLEAFIGAAFFPLFGPTMLALRAGVLLLFTLFLLVMYALTSMLYNKRLALITLVLLVLGSPQILVRETEALTGHPETPLFCAAIVLFTTRLALSTALQQQQPALYQRSKQCVLYGLWGLLVGAALWNDPLAWAYILPASVFLLLFCRQELRRPTYLWLLLGLIAGITPIVIYNLTAPVSQSTFTLFGFLFTKGQGPILYSLLDKIAGATLVSLPMATGANAVCTLYQHQAWPLNQLSPYALRCTIAHGLWGLIIMILWLAAFVAAIRALHKSWYLPLGPRSRESVLNFARVVMLAGAGLSFIVFMLSVQSITDPAGNSRYLVALVIALPAMFWPIWDHANTMKALIPRIQLVKRSLLAAILLIFAAFLIAGTVNTFSMVLPTQVAGQQQQQLVDDLLRLHATHIYTDYWTCDLVAFLSREQIICDVLAEQFQPGNNRYTPYTAIVSHDPAASYVFQIGSPQSAAFAKRIAQQKLRYRLTVEDNYDIYQPYG